MYKSLNDGNRQAEIRFPDYMAVFTNPNPDYAVPGLPVLVHGKVSARRSSTSTASADNAFRGRVQASPEGASSAVRMSAFRHAVSC